jgi:hypothetical protein
MIGVASPYATGLKGTSFFSPLKKLFVDGGRSKQHNWSLPCSDYLKRRGSDR